MSNYLIIGYFLGAGLFATMDYLRYKGSVGILRCFLLSLSFPVYILSVLLGIFYSFFGIIYVPIVKYVTIVEEDMKSILESQVKELEKLEKVVKDDNTPIQ